MQYRLRSIVQSNSSKTAKKVMGFTVPNEIAMFFEGCHFTMEKSGTCIIAYSGACITPTKNEVVNFDLRSVQI